MGCPKPEDHLWIVQDMLDRVLRSGKVPTRIPSEDLLSAGNLALVIAAHRYRNLRAPRPRWLPYCRIWVRRLMVREAIMLNGQRRTDSHHGGGQVIEASPVSYLPPSALRRIEEAQVYAAR